MPVPHSPHAPTNPFAPAPVGYCDRCAFRYPLDKLVFQSEWAGDRIVSKNLRVCPRCIDDLQENGRRTIVLGPEPKPLKDPRPGFQTRQTTPGGPFVLDDDDSDRLDVDQLSGGGTGTTDPPALYGSGHYDGGHYG